ncbi:MAG TPA: VOC family protein [Verrucomicrobiota bacterium]|nr:VOC family protein [Verrucomicrobiota bacterium]
MITSIAFTVYPVKDMAAARRFYENALGLKVEMNFQDVWVEYDIAGGTFAITTMDERHRPGANGAVVALEVDDLDACVAALKSKGVAFVQEPMATPVCRLAVISDPDGNDVIIHRRNAG